MGAVCSYDIDFFICYVTSSIFFMRKIELDEAVKISKEIYKDIDLIPSTMQSSRPYICPFEKIVNVVPERSEVLDIGCGAGLFLGLLASCEKLMRGVGFDVSPKAIEYANHMKQKLSVDIDLKFYCLDVNAPWPDGQFQVVSMIDVMHHVPHQDQAAFLRKSFSKVSAGGLLIYKDIGKKPFWKALGNSIHDFIVSRQLAHYFAVSDVERIAKESDFVLKYSRDIGRLWYSHELRVFEK